MDTHSISLLYPLVNQALGWRHTRRPSAVPFNLKIYLDFSPTY